MIQKTSIFLVFKKVLNLPGMISQSSKMGAAQTMRFQTREEARYLVSLESAPGLSYPRDEMRRFDCTLDHLIVV